MRAGFVVVSLHTALALAFTLAPQQPATPAAVQGGAQGVRAQGAKVIFERVGVDDAKPPRHSQRARLLSLAVERGEAPTPFVQPGLFRATYTTTLQLPARDRCRFRLEGRGSCKLSINGEVVLDGVLRPGKSLETAEPVRLKKGDNELILAVSELGGGWGFICRLEAEK